MNIPPEQYSACLSQAIISLQKAHKSLNAIGISELENSQEFLLRLIELKKETDKLIID